MRCVLIGIILAFGTLMTNSAINDPKKCDPKIVKNIISRKNSPTNILKTLAGNSPFTYFFNPLGNVPDTVKCAKGKVDHVNGNEAEAHVIVEYKNTNSADLVTDYRHKEVGPGHVIEYGGGKEFQLYLVSVSPCMCYYRCVEFDTEGKEFAACAAPIAKQSLKETQECVETCKKELAKVGVKVAFEDMTPCTK